MTPTSDGAVCDRRFIVFRDQDGDGHGSPNETQIVCGAVPSGWVTTDGDCNDACGGCAPDGVEVCDGLDNDCDGVLDNGLDLQRFHRDEDGDGAGIDDGIALACSVPPGYADEGGDCDDRDELVRPGAPEICDGLDQNCDGSFDEGVVSLLGPEQLLGDTSEPFRAVAVEAHAAGWLAVWSDAAGRIVYSRIDPRGVLIDPFPVVIADAGVEHVQEIPVMALREDPSGTRAVIAWREDGEVHASVLELATGETSAPIQLSTAGNAGVMPFGALAIGSEHVAVLWQESNGGETIHGRLVDAGSGAPFGQDTVLFRRMDPEPSLFGASAVVVDAAEPFVLLAIVDRRIGDDRGVAYVVRVRATPGLEPESVRTRLEPPRGTAAKRVLLVGEEDADPFDSSVLAFVSWGEEPDEETGVWALTPGAPAAVLPARDLMRVVDGLVLDGTAADTATDVTLRDVGPLFRHEIDVWNGSIVTAATFEIGSAGRYLDRPWAAIARRTSTDGILVYAGTVSESQVRPAVWIRRYGCR